MKMPDFLKNDIEACDRESFEQDLIMDNIRRAKLLALVIIGIETVLLITDIVTSLLKVDSRFAFDAYLMMYLLMIAVNIFYLLLLRRYGRGQNTEHSTGKQEAAVIIYITFVMSWGSVVSLMDQKLYGQLMTFMVNMIVCSVIYLLDNKKILIPYIVSVLILGLGLPFFQKSGDILIGHYVNLSIFIAISWITSRILYHSYCNNYAGRKLLNKYNRLLQDEIEENRRMNVMLAAANKQLQALALQDELTGIPNRRSFQEFMDRAFQRYVKEDSTLSIIMIDIDFFKQYNDRYGHEEGDKTLIAVAGQLNAVVEEPSEFAVRWGGEEFIYAAFNKSREEIEHKAQTISTRIAALKIDHMDSSVSPYITVSLGISTIRVSDKNDVVEAVKRADRALYKAKSSGRNSIVSLDDKQQS